MRLDIHLSNNLKISRNKAQSLIREGLVEVGGKITHKTGYIVNNGEIVKVLDDSNIRFVSRSAKKLDDFLGKIGIILSGFVCMDIGASTGGFTQIMIEHGAKKVYSIDVGSAQLHKSLRFDKRIISIENMDIRNYKSSERLDLIAVDVSFISLRKIIYSIIGFSDIGTNIVLLFKPQFEVGKENITRKGLPKDDKIIQKSLREFIDFLGKIGFEIIFMDKSTLPGEAGNLEYLIFCKKSPSSEKLTGG